MDVEDRADILLRFASGAVGAVHLDMVQRAPSRTCRVVGSDGALVWDGIRNQVRSFSAAAGQWTDLHPACDLDRNEMYVAELQHFVDCVNGKDRPLVTGEDGRRVLEIALAAKQSATEGRVVQL